LRISEQVARDAKQIAALPSQAVERQVKDMAMAPATDPNHSKENTASHAVNHSSVKTRKRITHVPVEAARIQAGVRQIGVVEWT
jgi:hypothetical protein